MADFLKGFMNNLAQGALNPKGNLGDYQHGARLYVDDSFRLAPKQKFLYHCTFNINRKAAAVIPQLTEKHQNELNMLVKSVDLPKFNIQTDVRHQYNKKRAIQKRLDYDPVNITFHDDNYGVTTAMWEAYYRYYYRDGNYAAVDGAGNPVGLTKEFAQTITNPLEEAYNRGAIFKKENQFRYGFDNDSFEPFFTSIIIYQMSRKRYTAFTLVNPIISVWQHDTMDQTDNSGTVQSVMTIEYETVFYTRGPVTEGSAPKGFASEHYDKTPSPLSLAGGGISSILGSGGVLRGGIGVLGDILSGSAFSSPGALLGTVLKGANVGRNLKNLSKEGIREEGFNILKDKIGQIGKGGGGGLSNFSFPKSGGLGDISTSASALSNLAGNNLSGSLSDVRGALASNPQALDDLTAGTTYLKDHLRNGGSAVADAVRSGYNGLTDGQKNALKETTQNNLANVINDRSGGLET